MFQTPQSFLCELVDEVYSFFLRQLARLVEFGFLLKNLIHKTFVGYCLSDQECRFGTKNVFSPVRGIVIE